MIVFFAKFKVTDVGVTRFSPHGQLPSVGRIKLRNQLADFRILLAIFCTPVQHLAPYTQFEQHRDLVYHPLYGTQMAWV